MTMNAVSHQHYQKWYRIGGDFNAWATTQETGLLKYTARFTMDVVNVALLVTKTPIVGTEQNPSSILTFRV